MAPACDVLCRNMDSIDRLRAAFGQKVRHLYLRGRPKRTCPLRVASLTLNVLSISIDTKIVMRGRGRVGQHGSVQRHAG